ncbi:hypothetical protein DFH08DRAFT_897222, partial [Mycena albidolilacea]
MAATATFNDVLLSSVPTLKITSDGNNFPIFSLRFLTSVDAKGYLGHFDGLEPRPTFEIAPLTQAQADELTVWDKAEWNSKTLILQRVPDSIALLLNLMPTVADIWNHIVGTYSTNGAYARTNLRSQFLQSKCPASGNVREFLDNLSTRRAELGRTNGMVMRRWQQWRGGKAYPAALAGIAARKATSHVIARSRKSRKIRRLRPRRRMLRRWTGTPKARGPGPSISPPTQTSLRCPSCSRCRTPKTGRCLTCKRSLPLVLSTSRT